MDNGKELIVRPEQIQELKPEPQYLIPVMNLDTAQRRLAEFQEFVRGYLVEGEDYGIIPGTKQRTLLKPGADKLSELYGLAPTFPAERQKSVEDWAKSPPFIKYTATCVLMQRRTGNVVGECMASCNSYETKYKFRWKNGQRVINDAIADTDNTLLKMAEKRALVGAVIAATRSSGIFTQDMEDMSQEEEKPKLKPSPKKQATTPIAKPLTPEEREKVVHALLESPNKPSLARYCQELFNGGAYARASAAGDEVSLKAIKDAAQQRRKELDEKELAGIKPEDFGVPMEFTE
jgi:hypothetical protein